MTGQHRGERHWFWHPWRRVRIWRLYAIPFEWALVGLLLVLVFK